LRDACGVVVRDEAPATGRLFITGEDALDLLNRLTTNKLEVLPEGQGITTVITNPSGRVVDLLALAALDNGMWSLTSPGYAQTVIDWLDMYTFAEDITVVDRTDDTFHLTVAGPSALSTIVACTPNLRKLPLDTATRLEIANTPVVLWRRLSGGSDAYEIIGDVDQRETVLATLIGAGADLTSATAWEAYRIVNGMPAVDAEFGLFNNPLEARLLGSISETKGCYTGQEILARLQTYNKVQRRLMAVDLDTLVAVGTKLMSHEGRNAGQITSITQTPDGVKGLALVTSKLAIVGVTLAVDPAGTATLLEPAYALATEVMDG
jgi:folate-binding protein YgfZ